MSNDPRVPRLIESLNAQANGVRTATAAQFGPRIVRLRQYITAAERWVAQNPNDSHAQPVATAARNANYAITSQAQARGITVAALEQQAREASARATQAEQGVRTFDRPEARGTTAPTAGGSGGKGPGGGSAGGDVVETPWERATGRGIFSAIQREPAIAVGVGIVLIGGLVLLGYMLTREKEPPEREDEEEAA